MLYDTARRPPPWIEELVENWRYRDLLRELIGRDLKLRYKRSSLGIVWSMLNPLLMMAVLTLVFSNLFKFAIAAYPVYLLSGTVVWTFFSQSTNNAMASLRWGGALFSKIYLPRSSFALSSVGTNTVNLAIAIVPLLTIAAFYGLWPSLAILWLIPAIVLTSVFAIGVALFLSSLALVFPDVIDIYAVLLSAWYFLTPIMYPVAILPESIRWIAKVNPMTYFIELFRAAVYSRTAPDPSLLAIATLAAFVSVIVGWLVFAMRSDEISYRV